jgi:NAD(P)H dehydrogenase (quinone)
MNASLIIGHPSATSFSHAMAQTASETLTGDGWPVWWHDLYAENFDPILPGGESANFTSDDLLVEQHCAEIAAADLILIFHPNWWGQPPAMLKGWIDRVLRPGVAYDFRDGSPADVPVGLLQAKAALVFNTSNTPWAREVAVFGNPLETLWKNCVFAFCGVNTFERRVYGPMFGTTPEERAVWLNDVARIVRQYANQAAQAQDRDLSVRGTTKIEASDV